MFCEKCGAKMIHHVSFSKQRNVEYEKCPKCGFETRKVPIDFNNIKSKTMKIPNGKE